MLFKAPLKHNMRFLITFLCVSTLTACYSRLTAKQLEGVYTLHLTYGDVQLQLLSAGRFVQTASMGDKGTATAIGTWTVWQRSGSAIVPEEDVVLTNALVVDDGFGHLSRTWSQVTGGKSILRVAASSSSESLIMNDKLDLAYQRK